MFTLLPTAFNEIGPFLVVIFILKCIDYIKKLWILKLKMPLKSELMANFTQS